MATQHSNSLPVTLFLSGKLKITLLSQKEREEFFTEDCAVKEIIAVVKNSPEVHTVILAH